MTSQDTTLVKKLNGQAIVSMPANMSNSGVPNEPRAAGSGPERIGFMASRDDFRAARTRCAMACEKYNNMSEDATTNERLAKWLNIIDPGDSTGAQASLLAGSSSRTTGGNRPPAGFPYIKGPLRVDYGLRVRVGADTFINRNCFIMDTPVADVTIGERCSLGPNITIVGVGHPVRYDERMHEAVTGKPGSWGAGVDIGRGVWIGAGAIILPGVTIGEFSVIGAGSVVSKDVPAWCVAAGNPARVLYAVDEDKAVVTLSATAETLEEALKMGR